jgi:Domain of unknown function (DUF1906)
LIADFAIRTEAWMAAQWFGIDTQTSHLDLMSWTDFETWNNGLFPAFAGRNFIGLDFLWTPAEATNALNDPHPEDTQQLVQLTLLIAPIQGASATRQQVVGDLGMLYGRIDATAICKRLSAAIATGELSLKASNKVNIYLQVDPAATFSSDYWSGWADTVFLANYIDPLTGFGSMPFNPCIMCAFTLNGAVLRIDPHVPAALQAAHAQHQYLHTSCFGFWADAPDLEPALQRPNPPIDFSRFAPTSAPVWLWRFARTLLTADGQPISTPLPPIAADAVNFTGTPNHSGSDFMLATSRWQPNLNWLNYGFATDQEDGITQAQIAEILGTPIPAFADLASHYQFSGGWAKAIGRYLKPTVVQDHPPHQAGHFVLYRAEALSLSDNFEIFTTWEDINVLAHGQPLTIDYFDPAIHAGTEDGQKAFKHCGEVLRQPPYSTVFFTVDFNPEDPANLAGLTAAQAKTRILQYFGLVKAQRDAYAQAHPGRYYFIGVYGQANTLEWCYRDPAGSVAMFWQSGSTGGSNKLPRRPWCHAHRWQLADNTRLDNHWVVGTKTIVPGADPDADWDDGGTWRLNLPLTQQLEQSEDAAARALLQQYLPGWFPLFNDLLL